MRRELSFVAGCLFELSLLVFALLWGHWFQFPVLADVRFGLKPLLIGAAAALPPLIFFLWTLRSELPIFRRHRRLMEELIRPMFSRWSVVQLGVLSLVAGVSEEVLFRAAIQGSLGDRVGSSLALVLASLAFGAVHLLTWTYGGVVVIIGAYLGWLWIWTGNLLVPITVHAVYDFLALVYFLRIHRPENQAEGTERE
jgi:membrane protease YdiL (CAAX protease family)